MSPKGVKKFRSLEDLGSLKGEENLYEEDDSFEEPKPRKKGGFGGGQRKGFDGKKDKPRRQKTVEIDPRDIGDGEIEGEFPEVNNEEEIKQESLIKDKEVSSGSEVLKIKTAIKEAEEDYALLHKRYEEITAYLKNGGRESGSLDLVNKKLQSKESVLDFLEERLEKYETLNSLGFNDSEIKGLLDKEKEEIISKKINKKDWVMDFNDSKPVKSVQEKGLLSKSEKGLLQSRGFSLNQIEHIFSADQMRDAISRGLKMEDFLEEQRSENRQKYGYKKGVEDVTMAEDRDPVFDDEYKEFTDTGKVPEHILRRLAYLVTTRKRKLSPREEAIFADKAGEINKLIKEREAINTDKSKEDNSTEDEVKVKEEGFEPIKIKANKDEEPTKSQEKEKVGSVSTTNKFGSTTTFTGEGITDKNTKIEDVPTPEGSHTTITINKVPIESSSSVKHPEDLVSSKKEAHEGNIVTRLSLAKRNLKTLNIKLADHLSGKNKLNAEILASLKKSIERRKEEISLLGGEYDNLKSKKVSQENLSDNNPSPETLETPEKLENSEFSKPLEDDKDRTPDIAEEALKSSKAGISKDIVFKKENSEEGLPAINVAENKTDAPKEESQTVESFVDFVFENTHNGIVDKNAFSDKQLFFYKKNKEAIKKIIEERRALKAKEQKDLSARGVSEGAKEFIKSEVDKAIIPGLQKNLETKYEDEGKPDLVNNLKERNLSFRGDKQKLIDRLVKNDIENKKFNVLDKNVSEKIKSFGMEEKDMLAKSPEFFNLSPEKQIYVLNKIDQRIFSDSEMRSKLENEENIKNTKGFFKGIKARFLKDKNQISLRGQIIEEIKTKGLLGYREDINLLIDHTSSLPEMNYAQNEKGKMVPYFKYFEVEENDPLRTQKIYFNSAASAYGEMPFEWSQKSATSAQREAYHKAYSSYNLAREALLRGMSANSSKENINETEKDKNRRESIILADFANIDGRAKFGQLIMSNPELETGSKNFFKRIVDGDLDKSVTTKAFFVAGFGAKKLARSFASLGIGMGVAGLAGGVIAWRKKNLEYTEKELRQRYGVEAKEIIKGREQKDGAIKNFIDSKKVSTKLEKLIERFENNSNNEKIDKMVLESIKNRIFVTTEMMKDGRINFGSEKEQMVNKFNLSKLLSRAGVLVELNGGFSEEKTREEETFERFKDFIKDDLAERYQNKKKAIAALKGAALAAAGFGTGFLARYAVETYGDKLTEVASGLIPVSIKDYFSGSGVDNTYVNMPKVEKPNLENFTPPSSSNPEEVMETARKIKDASESANPFGFNTQESVEGVNFNDTIQEKTSEGFEYKNAGTGGVFSKTESLDSGEYVPPVAGGEFGERTVYPNIKGEYEFIRDENGKIIDVNTSRTISDEVTKFRQNPRNFMSEDLSQTDLLAKTDSFAVKTLTNNRPEIENLIKENHILNAPNEQLAPDEKAFLEQRVSEMKGEISEKTGKSFDLKDNVKSESAPTQRPRVISSFETDAAVEKPSVKIPVEQAPSESPEIVKEPTPSTPAVESSPKILGTNTVEMGGKEYKVTFARSADGKLYIPEGATAEWGSGLSLADRQDALEKFLKPNYYQKVSEAISKNGGNVRTSFNPVFERYAVAEKLLGSDKFQPGTAKYEALESYIGDRKEELTKRFGDIFKDSLKIEQDVPVEVAPEVKVPEVLETKPSLARPEATPSVEKLSAVKQVLDTDRESVYEFNSKEVKGQIKFLRNEKGGIDGMQYSKDFKIDNENQWRKLLGENWKSNLENAEIKNPDGSLVEKAQVKSEMEELVRLRMLKSIKQDSILSDSSENRYMTFRTRQLELKYRSLLKRF